MESRIFPVDSVLLPDQSKWPRGYLGTVVAELLEKYKGDMAEVCHVAGVGRATAWRVNEQVLREGYDWREVRKKLEKRYNRQRAKYKDGRGRPTKEAVYTSDGTSKPSETEPEKEKPVVISGGEEFEAETEEPAQSSSPEAEKKKKDLSSVSGVGVQTRRPVVTFKVANHEIPIDPDGLFELYFIYVDIQRRTGCTEDFMATLKLGMETLWRISSDSDAPPPETAPLRISGDGEAEEIEQEELELVPVGG